MRNFATATEKKNPQIFSRIPSSDISAELSDLFGGNK